MNRLALTAGNVVGFQLVWLASVGGAGAGMAWAGPVAALVFAAATLAFGGRRRDDLRLLLVALPLGTWAATWRRTHDGVLAELAGPFEYLMVWICIGVILQLFYRLVRRESRMVRLVCESSYSVYLMHHFVVVLVTIALLPSSLGIGAKVAIGIVTTFVLTTGIHVAVVARSPVLQFLLNGRPPRRARTEPAEWQPSTLSSRAASSAS